MAVVRAKTSNSYGVTIFLVFLIVLSAAIAVMFYMKTDKLEKDAKVAQSNLAILGSNADVNDFKSPTRFGANDKKRPLREAIDEVDALRFKIASGEPGVSPDVPASVLTDPDGLIDDKLEKLGFQGQSLLKALDLLATQSANNESRAKGAEEKLTAAQTTNTDERTRYEADRDAWRKSLAQLQQDKDQLLAQVQLEEKSHKDDIAKYEADKDTQVKGQAEAEKNAAVKLKQKEDEVNRLNGEIARLQTQLARFKPKNPADLSNEPDGRIIRVDPNTDVAYVNIGSAERASRGLTFAVYDPKFNINTTTADGQGHEKAFIELVEVGEHESTARITHAERDQTVAVGDIIANPIFHVDRNRKFHFFVFGEFDLDGDGVATPAEHDQLIRLIQNWGGIIDDQFTTQTDFLILGGIPGSSTHVFETGTDEDKARDQQRINDQKTYNDLIGKAHDWSIPVLNSNRFLTMIGYYNTSTVIRPLYKK